MITKSMGDMVVLYPINTSISCHNQSMNVSETSSKLFLMKIMKYEMQVM